MLVSGGKVIAIDYIKTNSATLSGDGVWTELGLNTSATIDPIKNDISSLSSNITNISGDLYNLSGDVLNISSDIDYLSAEIDTKQKQLSAGKYIEILSGDEYDTITVTGIEDNDTTYFNAKYNRGSSSEYFTFDGSALSASPKVAYFNICLNYKIDTNDTCVDNYYSASVLCNNRVIDSHYIFGAIPSETYNYSKNVLNDAYNNLYTFTFEEETGLNVNDMNITCIGFINDLQPITIDVLGDRGDLLTFGNTLLRV